MSPLGFAACQSKKCTNRVNCAATGGALVSSAPTEQAVPQHITTYANNTNSAICYVGALETSAPPERHPKFLSSPP